MKSCNCRVKSESPLNCQCQVTDIICKGTVNKVYVGTAESDFKKQFYNDRNSFDNEASANDTNFSKYIWVLKNPSNLSLTLVWSIAKKVPPYYNTSKNCLLCLHEKLEIINYPQSEELLNKISEYSSVSMLISFYCAIIKQSIDCNLLIGKQQWIQFYVGMFVITSLICLNIVKYMKLKVANKLL